MKTRRCSIFVLPFLLFAAAQAGHAAAPPPPAPEATIQVFEDKAAFLAATGAANATGPLPNLGLIADPGVPAGSATVGSITFSLAPGPANNSLAIGGGSFDWYPQTPGNDIALSYENLQVQTAAPVYALGFEVVEPAVTMPIYGGVPAPSPLLVTLFSGATQVGQFVIDVPDDVPAFVGVWSDTPFNRVTISDSTGNDDDEYFGQFYTATVPAAARTFTAITGSGTAVPGGAGGVFTAFPGSATVSAGVVSFLGSGSTGSFGIYSRDSASPRDPTRLADLRTAIPGGTGTFTGFSGLAASGSRVSFLGTGAGQAGIYLGDRAAPQDPLRIADLKTAIPNGTGTFTGFTATADGTAARIAANGTVVFGGAGTGGQAGIYTLPHHPTTPQEPTRVADRATTIPGGTGTFIGFGDRGLCPVNGQHIAFVGLGSGGQAGIYDRSGGVLSAVVTTATPIPGGTGTFTGFGGLSLLPQDPVHALRMAFVGFGDGGQQGVFSTASGSLEKVADLKTPIPGGTGTFTSFGALSGAAGHNAFIGLGSSGQKGIFLASALTQVIAVGDLLGGKEITDLRFGPAGLAPGGLACIATFADGSEGVFLADLIHYPFSGFRPPVASLPQVNQAQAGQSIPVKFSLSGFQGFDILAPGFPKSEPAGPGPAAPSCHPGKSSLTYDAATDEYTYVWKTERSWAGTTREFVLKLNDGAVYRAKFAFRHAHPGK